jgi:putative PIN family toxin of toxin-antitoxin system
MPQPLVVVFDTNVLIPLSLKSGHSASARLLSRLRAAGHHVVISPQIHAELAEKMRTKKPLRVWLELSDTEIDQFIADVPAILGTEPLKGTLHLSGAVPADPKDDMVMAVAIEGHASYIVSEDPHLLNLKEYDGITIMSRADFMAELDRLGVPQLTPRRRAPRRRKRS